jgi:hypothetical protein
VVLFVAVASLVVRLLLSRAVVVQTVQERGGFAQAELLPVCNQIYWCCLASSQRLSHWVQQASPTITCHKQAY